VPSVFPVDEFESEEWYPGFRPEYDHAPWAVEPVRTFRKVDEERFWFLDFHLPRGLTPLGTIWNEDGYAWGTQSAAEALPLPSGRGVAVRMAGTHTYAGQIPVASEAETKARIKRVSRNLPAFLRDFEQIWENGRDEIQTDWNELRRTELRSLSGEQLLGYIHRARAHHKRAFEIHFQIMYGLLANYVGFYGQCTELGIVPGEIAKFLQGYDTKILETDRGLWRLTVAAREAGLSPIFATAPADQLHEVLRTTGGRASGWLSQFGDFLEKYGWRTEGICDVALPSWVEDPTPALGMIKTFLQQDRAHDFDAARAAAIEERETAVDAARSRLTTQEQRRFDSALASARAANFAWWNEDHDFYIDLRAMLPLRWAAQHAAERFGCGRPDDTLFLFWPELTRLVAGERPVHKFAGLIETRRQYYEHWRERRAEMPKVLGTVPNSVTDPILVEVFGLNRGFLDAICADNDEQTTTLTGVAASCGIARGPARVLHNADGLHLVQPGDVLVCESTSPNWTPAFAKIAACVCDGGGTLSHAAIGGREYRVPTVAAVGVATKTIRDGDEVEVDGTRGIVIVTRRSGGPDSKKNVMPLTPENAAT
jgi:phosphohistidine swiveling domain-containing protein